MSDVTVAPQGGAPQAAPANQVPINPNPVNAPLPVGQQAPDKPVGDIKGSEHRPQSRREAIQAAFDRANTPASAKAPARPARAEPKEAEAKPGHNNPPEPTEGIDLKKRPADQPRGERGRFASQQNEQQGEVRRGQFDQQAGVRPQSGQPPAHRTLPEGTPYREPPPRMADHAKAEWHAVPESVRGEVARMHHEFGQAYQQYRGDSEVMNTIRPFHQMATQHGTTLQRALSNYVGMEQKLRSDLIGGLDTIISNLNLPRTDGQKATLIDVAHHILNQSPEQHRLTQQSNAQVAQTHQIGALHQEIATLKNSLNQMHTGQQFAYLRQGIDQYAETHPRLDELADIIEQEISRGFDLDTAYRRADLLRPSHAAQTRAPSAQTRPTDKSIYGAPDAGPSNGTSRRPEKQSRSPREAVQNAIRRVNGAL